MDHFETLKLNKEFRRAYGRGASFVGKPLVTYVLKGRPDCRIGITTGKKIGGAVERNRARRVITAAFRSCLKDITKGCDIVFVARTRILSLKSTDVEKVMREHLKNAGVLENSL